jgi:hypothetical protein
VETITESFAGSITPNGAVTYFYNSTAAGTMTATILTLKPDSTVAVGLAHRHLGRHSEQVPDRHLQRRARARGLQSPARVSAAGSLCVRIFDTAAR